MLYNIFFNRRHSSGNRIPTSYRLAFSPYLNAVAVDDLI